MNTTAFPVPAHVNPTYGDLPDGNEFVPAEPGMTLRDYFAGQVLPEMSAFPIQSLAKEWDGDPNGPAFQAVAAEIARCAYLIADAMLAERQKGGAS